MFFVYDFVEWLMLLRKTEQLWPELKITHCDISS